MGLFMNPLSDENFSDPFITYDKETGYYYYIASCQCDILTIYRSKNVGDILRSGESKEVYICGEDEAWGPMWAPEMYKIGDNWYIYTSCREVKSDNPWDTKRLLILKSKTKDPFDGFLFGSKPDTSIFAIDPSSTFINGKQYICYSEVDEKEDAFQVLVMREMKDPLTFTENKSVIARPTLSWEMVPPYDKDEKIVEGAFFVRNKDRLFIIYSANGCWSDDYCLGVLEYMGGEVCSIDSWKKHPNPLFVKGNGIYGPGHASFFYSPDGSEVWCAYHCLLRSNPEAKDMIRHTCVQKIDFDETGFPVMGDPVGVKVYINSPSGEEEKL